MVCLERAEAPSRRGALLLIVVDSRCVRGIDAKKPTGVGWWAGGLVGWWAGGLVGWFDYCASTRANSTLAARIPIATSHGI